MISAHSFFPLCDSSLKWFPSSTHSSPVPWIIQKVQIGLFNHLLLAPWSLSNQQYLRQQQHNNTKLPRHDTHSPGLHSTISYPHPQPRIIPMKDHIQDGVLCTSKIHGYSWKILSLLSQSHSSNHLNQSIGWRRRTYATDAAIVKGERGETGKQKK